MARRTFSVIDVVEILQHWYAGGRRRRWPRSLGVDPKTVRQVRGPGRGGRVGPGRPAGERGAVAASGCGSGSRRWWIPGCVSRRWGEIDGSSGADRDLGGGGADVGDPPAADETSTAWRPAWPACAVTCEPISPTEVRRRGGDRVAAAGRPGRRGPGGLRLSGDLWLDPTDGTAPPGVGVLDGAVVLAAPVRVPGGAHGPAGLDRRPRGRRSSSSGTAGAGSCWTTCGPG